MFQISHKNKSKILQKSKEINQTKLTLIKKMLKHHINPNNKKYNPIELTNQLIATPNSILNPLLIIKNINIKSKKVNQYLNILNKIKRKVNDLLY